MGLSFNCCEKNIKTYVLRASYSWNGCNGMAKESFSLIAQVSSGVFFFIDPLLSSILVYGIFEIKS